MRCGLPIPPYRVGNRALVTIFQRLTTGTVVVVSQRAPGRTLLSDN